MIYSGNHLLSLVQNHSFTKAVFGYSDQAYIVFLDVFIHVFTFSVSNLLDR